MSGNIVLDFSEADAFLRVRNQQLVIETSQTGGVKLVPLVDIAVIIISHPQVVITRSVLSSLTKHGGLLVICDNNHMPTGMFIPCVGNSLQTERIRLSIFMKTRKRAWVSSCNSPSYFLMRCNMWLVIMFDLPSKTPTQKKIASGFRKLLLQNGCEMLQFSVYAKRSTSLEKQRTLKRNIFKQIPLHGNGRAIEMTDIAYQKMMFVKDGHYLIPESSGEDILLF